MVTLLESALELSEQHPCLKVAVISFQEKLQSMSVVYGPCDPDGKVRGIMIWLSWILTTCLFISRQTT